MRRPHSIYEQCPFTSLLGGDMQSDEKTVSHSQTTMTQVVFSTHTNLFGSLFGGVILHWVDTISGITALRHAGGKVATVSIDRVDFIHPVHAGWIVTLKSSVNYVSKTSMEIGVTMDAEDPITGKKIHALTVFTTYVGLDGNDRPVQLPRLITENEEQERRFRAGAKRREQRLRSKLKK